MLLLLKKNSTLWPFGTKLWDYRWKLIKKEEVFNFIIEYQLFVETDYNHGDGPLGVG